MARSNGDPDLLALLARQIAARGEEIALRQKSHGIWRELSWERLGAEVHRAAAELGGAGELLLAAIDAEVSAEAVILWLATLDARAKGGGDWAVQGATFSHAAPDASDEALGLPGLSLAAYVQHVLPAWLTTGFTLNFVEPGSSADRDRRELGPTLLFATAYALERLQRAIEENLPPLDTATGKFVHAALSPSSALSRTVGGWLVKPRLRDVVGLSRVAALWIVGRAPSSELSAFFTGLGVRAELTLLGARDAAAEPPVEALQSWPSLAALPASMARSAL